MLDNVSIQLLKYSAVNELGDKLHVTYGSKVCKLRRGSISNYLITESEIVTGKPQTEALPSRGQYGRPRFEIFP